MYYKYGIFFPGKVCREECLMDFEAILRDHFSLCIQDCLSTKREKGVGCVLLFFILSMRLCNI